MDNSKINMRRILWRLDYLCIEIISMNIHRFSRISKETWRLRHWNDLGDKLILACISNSFEEMNENVYDFILSNFSVRKLRIFPKMFEKVQYFDFLNGKSFEKLNIEVVQKMKFKIPLQDIRLETNVLKIFGNQRKNTGSFMDVYMLKKNYEFLLNIHVHKEIKFRFGWQSGFHDESEILLNLLKNTSKKLEIIDIPLHFENANFSKEFRDVLLDRKNLQNLHIKFYGESPSKINVCIIGLFWLKHTYNNSESINNIVKALQLFNSINTLEFCFQETFHIYSEIEEYFFIANSMTLNNVRTLKISGLNINNHLKSFKNLLENCPKLEELKFNTLCIVDLDVFHEILHYSKALKILDLNNLKVYNKINNNPLKNFFPYSSLQNVSFWGISFTDDSFFALIVGLENFQDILISLKIEYCKFQYPFFHMLPQTIKKLHKLKSFTMKSVTGEPELLIEIFKSLQSSSKTLQKISISFSFLELNNSVELFELLRKCNKLTDISIDVKINEDKIPELILLLTKFQNILKKINFNLCFNKKYSENLLNFLSGCTQLKAVKGTEVEIKDELKKQFLKSIDNSKYSVKLLFYRKFCNFNRFPHFLF